MLFSTIGQGWEFLLMLAAGAAIGLWYGLLAAVRRLLAAGFWLSLGADLAFGAGAAALFCAALTAADYGRFRLFAVLAALLGFSLCAIGVCLPVREVLRVMKGWVCRIFVTIRRFRWIKVIFR